MTHNRDRNLPRRLLFSPRPNRKHLSAEQRLRGRVSSKMSLMELKLVLEYPPLPNGDPIKSFVDFARCAEAKIQSRLYSLLLQSMVNVDRSTYNGPKYILTPSNPSAFKRVHSRLPILGGCTSKTTDSWSDRVSKLMRKSNVVDCKAISCENGSVRLIKLR